MDPVIHILVLLHYFLFFFFWVFTYLDPFFGFQIYQLAVHSRKEIFASIPGRILDNF